jgi:uncharacterized protein YlaI
MSKGRHRPIRIIYCQHCRRYAKQATHRCKPNFSKGAKPPVLFGPTPIKRYPQ